MTNHVHLLVTAGHVTSLPKVLQSLGRRYVRYINGQYLRSGTLWEGRYKSTVVDSETYVLACHRYIEANPLRAGMVDHAANYPWSSFPHDALARADPILTEHPMFTGLGATPEARRGAYLALFHQGIDQATLGAIRDATQRSWALGSDRFQKEIEQALQRRATPLRRGRPPKSDLSVDECLAKQCNCLWQ
jgi:putative transposase